MPVLTTRLSVDINVIINLINESIHQNKKYAKIYVALCKSKMRKCHAMFFLSNQHNKKSSNLPWKSAHLNPSFHNIYPNYSDSIWEKLIAFRNIKLDLKNFTETSWTSIKHFLWYNFGKTTILHKPDPVAWREKRNTLKRESPTQNLVFWNINLESDLQSPKICSQMVLTFNFQTRRKEPTEKKYRNSTHIMHVQKDRFCEMELMAKQIATLICYTLHMFILRHYCWAREIL